MAENRTVTASMGWSPDLVATMTWIIGSFIAAVAIILTAPLDGSECDVIGVTGHTGYGSSTFGKFQSLWLTLVGAMIIGIGESEVSRFVLLSPGSTAVRAELIVIVVVLVFRGSNLPEKSEVSLERLPSVGPGRVGWPSLIFLVGGIALVLLLSEPWLGALTNTLVMALIVLSVVVVSGFAGRIITRAISSWLPCRRSLRRYLHSAQFSHVGCDDCWGYCHGSAERNYGLTCASNTEGSQLAIATLSLATVVDALVFTQPWTTKFVIGPTLPVLSIFGINLNPVTNPAIFWSPGLGRICYSCVDGIVPSSRRDRATAIGRPRQ